MKVGTDILSAQRMKPSGFGDPQSIYLALPAGQSLLVIYPVKYLNI